MRDAVTVIAMCKLGAVIIFLSWIWAAPTFAQPAAPDDSPPPATPGEGPEPCSAPPCTAAGPPPAAAPPPIVVAPPSGPPPAPPPPAHPGIDQGVIDDANSGRSWLMPTALTAPAGTWSFTDYELLSVGASYAATDHLGISLTTLIPIVSGQPLVGLLTAKYQVVSVGALRVAGQFAFGFSTGGGDSSGGAGTIGGVATLCLDHPCSSTLSGYVGVGFGSSGESTVPVLVAGSVAVRLSRHVKLVGEVDTGYLAGNSFDSTDAGFLLWYGLRFTSRNIGVDLGLMEPIIKEYTTNSDGTTSTTASYQVGFGDGVLPAGFPFVSFTYRGLDMD
jgi:hypothetical protein